MPSKESYSRPCKESIEWAFLCSDVTDCQGEGLQYVNKGEIFEKSESIILVFMIANWLQEKLEQGETLLNKEWVLQVRIKDAMETLIYHDQTELLHIPVVVSIPLQSQLALGNGHYFIELLADNLLEQRLHFAISE